MPLTQIAKILIIGGLGIALTGILLLLSEHFGWKLFKLPGDIHIQKKNYSIYFPVITSIILSIVASLVIYLINKYK